MEFWGREGELRRLRAELDRVREDATGRLLAIRGRRQVGKSRLLTEMVEQSGVPYLYTTAAKHAPTGRQLEQAMTDLRAARHPLPALGNAFAAPATTWADLLARLPLAFDGQPAIVILDEFPWAVESDASLDGVLQGAWDRSLERLPVLFVLVGSDVAMMERLTGHDQPLYGRAHEMVLNALTPTDVAHAVGHDRHPVDLLDTYLATGGYPRLLVEARRYDTTTDFVLAQLSDDQSPLSITGQRMLDAEFRGAQQPRGVLEAIGAAEVGHATFSSTVGNLGGDDAAKTAVTRALDTLVDAKKVITIDRPTGAHPKTKTRRYRITDPYLRFWFRYCAPHLDDIARGRADLAIDHFHRDYSSWRGKAIEPVVHDALTRLAATDERFTTVTHVGAWWDRTGDREYDIAAADRRGTTDWLGTIKWRPNRPVDRREILALAEGRRAVPNAAGARLLAVCPAGAQGGAEADAVLDADDIIGAWSG
jgi:AAA+ ATPase superfamily predicted ATPase